MKKKRSHTDDLRSAAKLAVTAVTGVTRVVEDMHRTIAEGPAILGKPLSGPARALTRLAYGTVRGVTRLVGGSIDLLLEQAAPLLGESVPGPEREALRAALNGVLGDHLFATKNPLAIEMRFRSKGQPLELDRASLARELPHATSKLLLLVHGSSLNDLEWTRLDHNHGEGLARDLGYTPIFLHYNSGLHISTNGRSLASLLERLVESWPVDLNELAIIGHSMGGLVARSACHYGEASRWRSKFKKYLSLGTPHQGAGIERMGNWFNGLIELSRYSRPLSNLAKIRSAGVTDLRFGNVLDEDWEGRERFARAPDSRHPLPLPDEVDCFAIAGTTAPQLRARLPGDGLVSVDSALGRHTDRRFALEFPEEHQWIGVSMNHLDLLGRLDAYQQMRLWFGGS